jgi:2-oxoglutarate dehydrogenase E1 component
MNNSNRKPLVIITPKYLLHHRRCQSLLEDFDERSSFRRVICDGDAGDQLFNDGDNTSIAQKQGDEIRKVLLCSGKIWYDLSRHRTANKIDDVILVRLEQIFPFPYDALARRLTRFPNAKLCWVQEEPKNMGAWSYIKDRVKTTERASSSGAEWMRDISYVGRSPAASPATGSQSVHLKEAEEIVREAFK